MTIKEKLLTFLESQKDIVISQQGYREYLCLLNLIEDGVITSFRELAEYGVEK